MYCSNNDALGTSSAPRFATITRLQSFQVDGSSLGAVNGIYGPKLAADDTAVPEALKGSVDLGVFPHDGSGWVLASLFVRDKKTGENSANSEWVLLDAELNDRFGQTGNEWTPQPGKLWKRLRNRPPRAGAPAVALADGTAANDATAGAKKKKKRNRDEEDDELPWLIRPIPNKVRCLLGTNCFLATPVAPGRVPWPPTFTALGRSLSAPCVVTTAGVLRTVPGRVAAPARRRGRRRGRARRAAPRGR